MRSRFNYWVDVVALAGALLAFPTGLILLARFHIGPDGQERLFWLGLGRADWINLHRSAALVLTFAIAVHVQAHWKIIVARLQRTRGRLPGKASLADLALYFGFAGVATAAFAAWFIVPRVLHHPVVDVHNVLGAVVLPALIVHVRRYLRWLFR